jgi:hypothetical protein
MVFIHLGFSATYNYKAKTSLSGEVLADYSGQQIYKRLGRIAYGINANPHAEVRVLGWARFGLGRIPDNASVTGVDFCMYQYWSLSFLHRTVEQARLVRNVEEPAETLYNDITSGTPISDWDTCYDGWDVIALDSGGCAAVESCLAQGYIDLGLGWKEYLGNAYGYDAPSDLKAYLRIDFTSSLDICDMVAQDAYLSTFPCRATEAETVSFRVACQGENSSANVTAFLDLDGATVDSQALGEVEPGETLTTHLAFVAPAQQKKLQLSCYTRVSNDSLTDNDTASLDCWCFPASATAAVDFEPDHFPSFPPPGWVLRGTSPQWMVNPIIDLDAHTGRRYASSDAGDSTRNTWLITSALYPSPAANDSVGLFLRSNGSYDRLQAFALSAQDTSAQLGLLMDDSLDQNWREYKFNLDAFDRLPVYIGIRRSSFVGYGVRLDDVWFSCPTVPAVADKSDSSDIRDDVLPTIAGRVLFVPNAIGCESQAPSLLDIGGRKVMDLKPGTNDVRALAPGVYFVREQPQTASHKPQAIRKVVVTK